MRVMDDIVASGKLDETSLKRIALALAEESKKGDGLARAFRGERVFVLAGVEEFRKGNPGHMLSVLGLDLTAEEIRRLDWDKTSKDLAAFCDAMVASAGKPAYENLKGGDGAMKWIGEHRDGWDIVTRTLAPVAGRIWTTAGQGRVMADIASLRVGLERFKLAKKSYPRALAELVPDYLDRVPDDPFSGKPYGYRPEAKGDFTLWSVGADLKDDNGQGPPDARNFLTGPDYVFTSRAAKE